MNTILRLVRDGWRKKADNLHERVFQGKVVGQVLRLPDGSWRWTVDLGRVTLGDFTYEKKEAFDAVDRLFEVKE